MTNTAEIPMSATVAAEQSPDAHLHTHENHGGPVIDVQPHIHEHGPGCGSECNIAAPEANQDAAPLFDEAAKLNMAAEVSTDNHDVHIHTPDCEHAHDHGHDHEPENNAARLFPEAEALKKQSEKNDAKHCDHHANCGHSPEKAKNIADTNFNDPESRHHDHSHDHDEHKHKEQQTAKTEHDHGHDHDNHHVEKHVCHAHCEHNHKDEAVINDAEDSFAADAAQREQLQKQRAETADTVARELDQSTDQTQVAAVRRKHLEDMNRINQEQQRVFDEQQHVESTRTYNAATIEDATADTKAETVDNKAPARAHKNEKQFAAAERIAGPVTLAIETSAPTVAAEVAQNNTLETPIDQPIETPAVISNVEDLSIGEQAPTTSINAVDFRPPGSEVDALDTAPVIDSPIDTYDSFSQIEPIDAFSVPSNSVISENLSEIVNPDIETDAGDAVYDQQPAYTAPDIDSEDYLNPSIQAELAMSSEPALDTNQAAKSTVTALPVYESAMATETVAFAGYDHFRAEQILPLQLQEFAAETIELVSPETVEEIMNVLDRILPTATIETAQLGMVEINSADYSELERLSSLLGMSVDSLLDERPGNSYLNPGNYLLTPNDQKVLLGLRRLLDEPNLRKELIAKSGSRGSSSTKQAIDFRLFGKVVLDILNRMGLRPNQSQQTYPMSA